MACACGDGLPVRDRRAERRRPMRDAPQEPQQGETEHRDAERLVRVGDGLCPRAVVPGLEGPGQADIGDDQDGNDPVEDDCGARVAIADLQLHDSISREGRTPRDYRGSFRAVVSRSSASQTSWPSSPLKRFDPYSRILLSGTLTSGV